MRKLLVILAVVTGLGLLAVLGCTDAGDPVYPAAEGYTVDLGVESFGSFDNLWVNGSLTGDTPVALTHDNVTGWSGSVAVSVIGTFAYRLYYDDGSKAMVEVGGPYSVTVSEGGNVTGDTDVALTPNANDGFRIVVYCYNPAYDDIKLKGSVWNIDWSTTERTGMETDGDLAIFYRDVEAGLAEGAYEWGAIQDDGSEFGIWLMPDGPNYNITVAADGSVTGNLSYLIEAPEPETTLTLNCDMNAVASYTTVHVRGSFNGWSMSPTDLSDPDEDGIWTVDLAVEQNAEIIFKFMMDGSTYEDVPAACGADDGYGGYNRAYQMGTESATFSAPWAGCPDAK